MTAAEPTLQAFIAGARAWLESVTDPRAAGERQWGVGPDRVGFFQSTTADEERAQFAAARTWQQAKFDAGYGAIDWPVEHGGAGLPTDYEVAFRALEAEFDTPPPADAVAISTNLQARTLLALGSQQQRERWVRSLRRGDEICCQLFSEPGAGSDLGSIATRAVRDQVGWVVHGQKVWTSGAQYADLGYLICRTDPTAPRQAAFTAFLVPMDAAGVEVRPLRQMTGGSSFNEVFLDGVRLPDDARLGAVGDGWRAMMTTLGFERAHAAAGLGDAGTDLVDRLAATARHVGRAGDPVVRDRLAHLYVRNRLRTWTVDGSELADARTVPGAEGSLAKLAYTQELQLVAELAGWLVGPAMVADTGAWGTYSWSTFVCGVPGLRIAGGTDEIQKNTIADRVLGLPREPR